MSPYQGLFFIFFILLNSCAKAPERNCEKFKTGTFEFKTLLNGELATTRFLRSDSTEIDFFQGKSDTSSIRWINKCECILKNLNPKNRQERKALHLKILTTNKDTYTFEYGLIGSSKKQQGTAKKIN
ncbi:hypothetical protein [Aquimarina agarivorans]|uniref:hypothetical protein n=1 Tax=Aquimarina agarivorans TaxID=980584 RepID=UPI0002DD6656|nr:hypothetical protein [Aquimarina agarivorans]